MTVYDYIAIVALVLAIGVNSLSVFLQKRNKIYDRFGKKGLIIHSGLISFFWALFIASEFLIAKSTWRFTPNKFLGVLLMGSALLLFMLAMKQIGRGALANANFFGGEIRQLKGIYRYMQEPIYWSYCMWFLGLAFLTGQKGFFVITAIAVVGLIEIESRVERIV